MANLIMEVASNKIAISIFFSYFISNIIKVLIALVASDKLDIKVFIKTGGMPSSHTATVSALATSVYMLEGVSNLFIVSLMLSILVIADAIGIRRAAGKQAAVLNKIIDEFQNSRIFKAERLYELVGHTPKQVFVGFVLGILVARIVFMF